MTTVTITLHDTKEANLLIQLARKLGSVESIKSGKRNLAVKGEPMSLREFRSMIRKSEKSGFISAGQLAAEIKGW